MQFVVAAAPTVNLTSPPSLPTSSRLLFSHSPPPLLAPLPACLGSAQCNYFKLSLGCRCAASVANLWLPPACPLFPFPLRLRAAHFPQCFLCCFFRYIVHWFPLIGFLWCKVFLTPVTFLATFCCTCHTHLPIEQCDAISISILNTFLPLSPLSLSLFSSPFQWLQFQCKINKFVARGKLIFVIGILTRLSAFVAICLCLSPSHLA